MKVFLWIVVLLQCFQVVKLDDSVDLADLKRDLAMLEAKYSSKEVEMLHLKHQLQAFEQQLSDQKEELNAHKHATGAANIIAFSAYATVDRDYVNGGTNVIFDGVVLNVGDDYRADTSIFTCTTSGYYMFSTTIFANGLNCIAEIKVDDVTVAKVDANSSAGASSNTMVVQCLAGNQVNVRTPGHEHRVIAAYASTFTGVFLQLLE